jgi:hypothetical protein
VLPRTRGSTRHLLGLPAVGFALLLAGRADATVSYGPLQLSGSLQAQNLFRHPDASHWSITQQRNTARLQLEYKWLQNGKLIDKYTVPFVQRSDLFLLYRGVYDSIYDFTPGFIEKSDIHGDVYQGKSLYDYAKTLPATASPNGRSA